MSSSPKDVAPEPYRSAALGILYEAALRIRFETEGRESLSPNVIQEINALADAIHNVPESICAFDVSFHESQTRDALKRFDRLGAGKNWIRLEERFDALLASARLAANAGV